MESRNYWTACTTLNHLGHLSTDTQNFSSGLAHFEKARQLSVDVNHVIAQGAAHVGTARVAIYLGDLAKAREAICSSLKIAATLPSERQVLPWLATYVRFLSALGQMPEAAQLYALYQAHHERYKWRLSPLQTKELSDASITLPTAPIGTPTETGDVVRLTCRFLGCCCLAPGTAV